MLTWHHMLQVGAVVGWARELNWCCESDALTSAAAKAQVGRMTAAEEAAKANARHEELKRNLKC